MSGGVLISVAEVGDNRLRFTVADTGPGVPPADREHIFEAFAQSDPLHDGVQLGGAGLGLAIARTLARVMDGEVGLEDAPGGGAAFWMEASFPHTRIEVARRLAGRTIGVVSPNPVIAEAARRQIEACGGRALVSSGGPVPPEADVLLIDHALAPSGPPDGRPALILLTPEARGRIDDYRAQGFAGYLIKPLRRASLAERVLAAAGDAGSAHQRAADDERVAAASAPGARVLLVEDNAINALLARTLLTREGCAVDHAAGGQEALAALAVGSYDLILMDMRMPGMSGIEATRKVRSLGVTTPIVALTANVFEEDRHACLEAGMDDFLMKPLASDALRRVLAKLTRGGWTETAARAKVG